MKLYPDEKTPGSPVRSVAHLLEQGSGVVNEDTLFIEKDFFGVFDGATSIVKTPVECGTTGGCIAASTACSFFAKNGHPLPRLAINANNAIHRKMTSFGVDCSRREALWSTSAAVVRIKNNDLEWLQAGDATIILIREDGSHSVLVNQADHDYETLMKWKACAETSEFPIHETLRDQIRKIRCRMNRSYGVLNGEPEAEHFIHWGIEPLTSVTEILLFTDGLAIPSENPEPFKCFDSLVSLYREVGLNGLKDRIRALEQQDPQCRKFPRFKCHDDIAAVAVQLDPSRSEASLAAA